GSLVLIHEDNVGADTDVVMVQNDGVGNSLRIADSTADATPFVIDANGNVGIGTATPSSALQVIGNAGISGNLTVSGNDITMGVNTAGYILLSDGTNF